MDAYDRFANITRESFADFLRRYADNKADDAEWEHFVIQHYGDGFLEEIRRCLVRLVKNKMHDGAPGAYAEMVRAWAFLLRTSTNTEMDRKPDIATIDMTPAEAVLLDSILRRYSTSGKLTINSPAEQQCLWNVECLLEKHGDRPDWPTLEDSIKELTPEES